MKKSTRHDLLNPQEAIGTRCGMIVAFRVAFCFLTIILGVCCHVQAQSAQSGVGQPGTANVTEKAVAVQSHLQVLKSKASPRKERLQALHETYQARKTLSRQEQLNFWNEAKTVAMDKTEDAQLRADTIWVVGGLGMEFKYEKTMSHEEVVQQCQFLLQTAADESENTRVRRISITTLGNLKMKEGVSVVKNLLADKTNHNRSDIARSACVALSELAPEEALQPISEVLTDTTNSAVFGSAAYALGRINNRDALPVLVANRLRLGDNLSVDNAVEAMSDTVMKVLKKPTDPLIITAIKATRTLWRDEQKAVWRPLLRAIFVAKDAPIETRREALHQLHDDANRLPLEMAQKQLAELVPLIEKETSFKDELAAIQQVLNAQVLPPEKDSR